MTSGRIAEINKKYELVDDIRKGIAELDIVTYEYLLYHENRMEQQWNLKYKSLAGILNEAEEETFKLLRADFTALGNMFSQVTINHKKKTEAYSRESPPEKD